MSRKVSNVETKIIGELIGGLWFNSLTRSQRVMPTLIVDLLHQLFPSIYKNPMLMGHPYPKRLIKSLIWACTLLPGMINYRMVLPVQQKLIRNLSELMIPKIKQDSSSSILFLNSQHLSEMLLTKLSISVNKNLDNISYAYQATNLWCSILSQNSFPFVLIFTTKIMTVKRFWMRHYIMSILHQIMIHNSVI